MAKSTRYVWFRESGMGLGVEQAMLVEQRARTEM